MLATEARQPTYVGLDSALHGLSGAVKSDVNELTRSGNFYITPEVHRELRHIDTGVDHIKLDHEFLGSSKEWANKFDPCRTAANKENAVRAMDRAAGTMFGVKNTMNMAKIQSKQQNQVRQDHYDTVQNLRGVQRDVGPYAHESIDRIKQFCDHMGVTDRYTGYRHNLNRGNRDPVKMGYSWLNTQQGSYHKGGNVGSRPASSYIEPTRGSSQMQFQHGSKRSMSAPLNRSTSYLENKRSCVQDPCPNKSVQEQCGINMIYPGRTEYMNRYTAPPRDQPTKDYIINPLPDFTCYGRPIGLTQYEKSHTEYQNRYLWPDGSTMEKFPWIRK